MARHISSGTLANSFDRRSVVLGVLQGGVGLLLAGRMGWIALAQNQRYPLLITSLDATRLDDVASSTLHAPHADQARLGFAIAHLLDASAPAPTDLSPEQQALAAADRTARRPGRARLALSLSLYRFVRRLAGPVAAYRLSFSWSA